MLMSLALRICLPACSCLIPAPSVFLMLLSPAFRFCLSACYCLIPVASVFLMLLSPALSFCLPAVPVSSSLLLFSCCSCLLLLFQTPLLHIPLSFLCFGPRCSSLPAATVFMHAPVSFLLLLSSCMLLSYSCCFCLPDAPVSCLKVYLRSLVLLLSLPCCSKVGQDAGDQLMCLHALLA